MTGTSRDGGLAKPVTGLALTVDTLEAEVGVAAWRGEENCRSGQFSVGSCGSNHSVAIIINNLFVIFNICNHSVVTIINNLCLSSSSSVIIL